jgi:hypothetical protein
MSVSKEIAVTNLRVGQKVHYQPEHYSDDKWENGIIKEIREGRNDGVWIVYHCNGEWDNFAEYTGALTNLRDIKLGWRQAATRKGNPR